VTDQPNPPISRQLQPARLVDLDKLAGSLGREILLLRRTVWTLEEEISRVEKKLDAQAAQTRRLVDALLDQLDALKSERGSNR
jgi:predicted  nucleic acid-binding Zn-ribbon protein